MTETIGRAGYHLKFGLIPTPASRQTKIWHVFSPPDSGDRLLGQVRWRESWRCYAFHPYQPTCYDAFHLAELANFCEVETLRYKHKRD